MTYEEASKLTRSEKVTLVTCEASKPIKLFTQYSGSIYYKDVDYFVSSVLESGVKLTQSTTLISINSGEWFFDVALKRIYVWLPTGDNPKIKNVSFNYKFFFSNAPVILPYDLNNGQDVEWLPYIKNIGSIGQQLDDENVGIVLESQSNIEMINQGYFDPIFDSLIWENQSISFYSWFKGIAITEARKIFDGVIESKDYSKEKINFKVKDYVFRLRNQVSLDLFTELDGQLLDSIIGTPKRRVYGQVKQMKAIPLDCTLDGYPLTGTVSITYGSKIMTGVGTSFLSELNQEDNLIFIEQGVEVSYGVDLIQSNTSLLMSKNADTTFVNKSAIVDPESPWRFKNRRWHIAGHKIRETVAIIESVINSRTFSVDNVSEFYPNDVVRVGSVLTQITRVSGSYLILEQNIFPIPITGDTISRFPITKLHFNQRELIPFRDFTLINNNEAIINFDPLAEFNIAKEIVTDHNLNFNNGSSIVSSSSTSDLRTIIKAGDFIRSTIQTNDNWYEVHHVNSNIVYLKTPFTNIGNSNNPARIKKMTVINDDSLILVDCYGYDRDNKWLRTASDCVKHLAETDAKYTTIDHESFAQASFDCPYVVSLVIPDDVGGKAPLIRDVISKINDSVFGSLYGNSSQEIAYSIVNTRKPESLEVVKDDDILSWSVSSSQKIVNNVKVNYASFVDKITGSNGFNVVTHQSDFIDNFVGIKNTIEKTCYIFNQKDAEKIAQRTAFYFSLSQSVLTLKAKSNFFTSSVNDRIYVDLDRLYTRYGGAQGKKIGIISGIKKTSYDSEIIINDLGNIFNRCPTFAPSFTPNFTSSDDNEKMRYGYFLDKDFLTPEPTSDDGLGSNLLG